MFYKTINMTVTKDDYEVLDNEFVKTASEVVLPDGYIYDPDFLYIKVRGISAGETYGCNKNGDYFGREELKANYKTFLDAHVFKNHENKDVEKAIGDVMDAVWNDEMDYVELFIRINRKVAPTIVAGFEKGYMTDVSMGCRVHHTICSICGNRAKTPAQYCEHIRKNKHEIYPDGRKVFEINIAPKFHDISAVLNGADRTAKMTAMYVPAEKRAQLEREWGMSKVANHYQSTFEKSFQEIEMEKIAFEHCIQDDIELFEKKASSQQDALEKIAEIKKRIKGNVLRIARSRQELNNENSACKDFDKIVENSPIMGLEQMDNVSSKLLDISERENMPASKLLAIFLKLSMASGRIFSPSEVVGLMKRISRCPHTEMTPNYSGRIMSSAPTLLGAVSGHSQIHHMPIGLNGIISAIGRVFGGVHQSPSLNIPVSEPITRSRIVIMKLASDANENFTKQSSVVEEVAKIATENIYCEPSLDYRSTDMATDMFMILQEPETVSQSIEQLAYSVYLDEMTKYANSKEIGFDREYYMNSELEKTARLNSWNWTLAPGMAGFAYSKYQGARARKGESLSSFERATAENPEVAAGTAAIAGNMAARSLNSIPKKISNGLVRARRVLHRIAMDEILDMEKVSSDIEYENYFEKNFDMFNNDTIDGHLVRLGYSKDDIGRLKTASILYAYERADVCDNLLKSANLNYNDIETFLKTAVDYAENGLEKHAGIIGKVKKGIQVANPTLNTLANISGTMFLGEYALRGGKKLKDIIGSKIDPKTESKVRTGEHLAEDFFDEFNEMEKLAKSNYKIYNKDRLMRGDSINPDYKRPKRLLNIVDNSGNTRMVLADMPPASKEILDSPFTAKLLAESVGHPDGKYEALTNGILNIDNSYKLSDKEKRGLELNYLKTQNKDYKNRILESGDYKGKFSHSDEVKEFLDSKNPYLGKKYRVKDKKISTKPFKKKDKISEKIDIAKSDIDALGNTLGKAYNTSKDKLKKAGKIGAGIGIGAGLAYGAKRMYDSHQARKNAYFEFDEMEKNAEAKAMKLIMDAPFNIVNRGGSRDLANKVRGIGGNRMYNTVRKADKIETYYKPLIEKAKKDAASVRFQRDYYKKKSQVVNKPKKKNITKHKQQDKQYNKSRNKQSRKQHNMQYDSNNPKLNNNQQKSNQNTPSPNTPKTNKALLYGGIGTMGVGSAFVGKSAYDVLKRKRDE